MHTCKRGNTITIRQDKCEVEQLCSDRCQCRFSCVPTKGHPGSHWPCWAWAMPRLLYAAGRCSCIRKNRQNWVVRAFRERAPAAREMHKTWGGRKVLLLFSSSPDHLQVPSCPQHARISFCFGAARHLYINIYNKYIHYFLQSFIKLLGQGRRCCFSVLLAELPKTTRTTDSMQAV